MRFTRPSCLTNNAGKKKGLFIAEKTWMKYRFTRGFNLPALYQHLRGVDSTLLTPRIGSWAELKPKS